MRFQSRRALGLAAAALLLAGCSAPTTGENPAGDTVPSLPAAAPIAGTFDVGDGRQLYLECAGTGYPRVLIIPGQRAGVEEWQTVGEGQTAEPVFQQIAAQTRVCSYDRPGVPFNNEPSSRSDPAPMPTTAEAMVRDLRALLEAAGETGPTILVAHSLGGLPGLLYAATYPDEVLGLILVDALTPTLRDAETPEQWEVQKVLLTGDIEDVLVEYPDLERADLDPAFDQVKAALGDLPQVPYVVLTADDEWGPIVGQMVADGAMPPSVPSDFGYVLDEAQKVSRPATVALIPGGVWIADTKSGHIMHHDQPQLVADTILDMVNGVRAAS